MVNFTRKTKFQIGSSLVEVLVAMLIMAVGLLGLASLQVISIKNINNSQFRSLATTYAYDMVERMRSNPGGVSSNAYNAIDGSETEPSCTSSCSNAVIAQSDAYQWNSLISQAVNVGGLPNGLGTVTGDGSSFVITISWDEQDRDSSGGLVNNTNFTFDVQI